ncbi:MAG TPA: family 20 glycosylhydrolase [Bryobacteraceae bacterium]|nr:family 20 glycosylhydrolase [Bryobacteraceae bacterium]
MTLKEAVVISLAMMMPGAAAELNLMPWPAHVTPGKGTLALDAALAISVHGGDARVTHAVERFVTGLRKKTGVPFTLTLPADGGRIDIVCAGAGEAVQQLSEDESYTLTVDDRQAKLSAPNPLGVIHGLQTLRQLVQAGDSGWAIPAVTIEDRPRFAWRGLMIDVSRHFMPLASIRRNLDGMEAAKLNVFHWHLSDDQGFRVESLLYPKLQQMGSDGLYYTQDEIRGIIAYARDRGIRVIPEFDMPGHSQSWLVGYPELASAPGPYEIERSWSIHAPCIDPTSENTYTFLDSFIGEMAALFPDAFFHIGGDEVNGEQWNASTHIQEFMHAHNIKDNAALQAYFNQRVQAIVAKHGKRMEGWDEILDASLPKDITIQSWRGQKSLAEAARMGYDGLLSSGWYLDLMYSAATHYEVDPMEKESAGLTPEQAKHILGGEACEWAEYATPEVLDNRIWPRMGAIAERLWSPRDVHDVASMYRRLEPFSRDLEWLGLRHRENPRLMLQRLAGSGNPGALKTLASMVEPVKGYQREETNKYMQQTPLNRMVDAASPESDTAREFNALASRAKADPRARARLRVMLTEWRDNDAVLRPMLGQSFLLKELIPVSQNLTMLATAGLGALNAVDTHRKLASKAHARLLAAVDEGAKPHAELLIAIAPGVRALVEAAGVRK